LTDRLQGLGTGCREKRHPIELTSPFRQPRPERVAEEVELQDRVFASAIGVLAVDHFGLLWMEHQPAFGKPPFQDLTQRQGLALAPAVADDVVGVPLERHPWKPPLQPDIERVMQEQIGQEWADDPSLRRSSFPHHKHAVVPHRRRLQPTLDVKHYLGSISVFMDPLGQQYPVDAVEKAFDVDIEDPVVAPTPLARSPDRVDRRAPRAIAIRVRMELRFQQRLQVSTDYLLGNAISDR